jgi:hypothetical protein
MRVLLDTNIFIIREAGRPLPTNLLELLRMLAQLEVDVLVHPKSLDDLSRDGESSRRETHESKIKLYSALEAPPDPYKDAEFLRLVGGGSGPNDTVDNWILYAAFRDAVHYLITEDRDLLRRAEKIGIRDRVLSIDDARSLLARNKDGEAALTYPPAISKVPVYRLDLKDPFFDPLRTDYPPFDAWFRRIAREGRNGYVYFEAGGGIGALLILKVEKDALKDSQPPLPPRRRMKICTLQVSHQGSKIGELFVKLAVHEAIAADCEEVYLTHFVKSSRDELVELITEYGFTKSTVLRSTNEPVFLKELHASVPPGSTSPLEIASRYYPTFYDGEGVKKFLIPILPEFHQKLFVDYEGRQTTLPEYAGKFIIEGNTIKKAYLCNSRNKSISRGDVLLFYRSKDVKAITSIGTVEEVHRNIRSLERAVNLVERRTVYTNEEIKQMLRKPTMIILFKWHFHLSNPIGQRELSSLDISPPQTITRVSHRNYTRMKIMGVVNERFTVH